MINNTTPAQYTPTKSRSASIASAVACLCVELCLVLFLAGVTGNRAVAREIRIMVTDSAAQPVADVILFADTVKPAVAGMSPVIIDQINREFVPLVSVIQQGQSVIFPNSDNIRHHVYSFSTPKVFEIQLYEGVPKTPVVFDKPGVVVLGCNIHDTMVGYLLVAPGDVFAKTDASGLATLELASVPATLTLWHPMLAADKSITRRITLPAPSADGNIHITVELVTRTPATEQSAISRLRSLRRAP